MIDQKSLDNACCAACRFFKPGVFSGGRCRRFPPQRSPFIVCGFSFSANSEFPGVNDADWCGEFELRGNWEEYND